jgi:hypothetical protein
LRLAQRTASSIAVLFAVMHCQPTSSSATRRRGSKFPLTHHPTLLTTSGIVFTISGIVEQPLHSLAKENWNMEKRESSVPMAKITHAQQGEGGLGLATAELGTCNGQWVVGYALSDAITSCVYLFFLHWGLMGLRVGLGRCGVRVGRCHCCFLAWLDRICVCNRIKACRIVGLIVRPCEA